MNAKSRNIIQHKAANTANLAKENMIVHIKNSVIRATKSQNSFSNFSLFLFIIFPFYFLTIKRIEVSLVG
ncbi:hypothetical protein K708_1197 [Campylobacter coli JL-CDD-LMH]|nr:hypothetical protein K708_1197 [Campylobacter coli JL-CDD-LMH]